MVNPTKSETYGKDSLMKAALGGENYLAGYIAGQWFAADQLLNAIQAYDGPLRRSDMYRIIHDYRPRPPENKS